MLRHRGFEDDEEESRALHRAVLADDPQQLSSLLSRDEYKKRMDGRSGWGVPVTPLRLAASKGSLECLRILLAHGCEVDSLDVKAQTPLFAAVSAGRTKCVSALLQAGADPGGSSHNNCTPVLTAAREGFPDILGELLEYGAEPDVRANRASAGGPLYSAAVYRHLACFRTLLLHGADPNYNRADRHVSRYTKRPHSVLEVCLERRCDLKFVRLLIDFGADLNLPNLPATSLVECPALTLIQREKGQPRSLMSQCRVTIRRLLKQIGKLHLMNRLEIPDRMMRYLQHLDS